MNVFFSGKRAMFFGMTSIVMMMLCVMTGLPAEPASKKVKLDRYLENGYTPLIEAIYAEDADEAGRLLDAGASPDFSSEYGDLPAFALFREMRNEPARLAMLKLLVDHGVSVNLVDERYNARESLLMKAAEEGCLTEFRWLLDAGADTGMRNAYGDGLLKYIFESGDSGRHIPFMNELRSRGYDLAAQFQTVEGAYALRQICEFRSLGELEYLRDCGVPLGSVMDNGQNALFWFPTGYANDKNSLHDIAALQIDLAKLLVKAGCAAYATDESGNTPLRLACERRNFGLARYLRWREKKEHPSPDYFSAGYLSACLSAGLSWNVEEEKLPVFRSLLTDFLDDGMNPSDVLYAVCRITESVELTGLLLERGANPDTPDGSGQTALMAADEPEMLDLLLGANARVDPRDGEGQTALHCAARQCDSEKAKRLLAHGADINAASNAGETAFSISVSYGDGDLALLLLKAGADPTVRFEKNQNALAYLLSTGIEAESDDASLCLALLDAGFRADEKDDEGKSGLYYLALNDESCPPDISARIKASVDAASVAEAEALVASERREERRIDSKQKRRDTAFTMAFPVLLTTLSVVAREGIYREDQSENWMGNVNAVIGMGALCGIGGGLLGYIIDSSTDYHSGGYFSIPVFTILGLFGGTVVGIFMPLIPSVRDAFKDNAALYYMPTVAIDFVALWHVVDILQ